MNSKQVMDRDKEYVLGTYARNKLCIEKGAGAICFDPEGKSYIDFSSGIGVNSLGFSNPDWVKAISTQAGVLQHTSNLYYTKPCGELAEILIKRSGLKKVFFCNSGAEANEAAIKAARKYSSQKYGGGRYEIVTLINSFHGRTMATITATGQEGYHKDFHPFLEGFKYAKVNDFEHLKTKTSEKTCAIMIELIQGEGGVIPLEKGFVAKLAALCKEKDILLIVDEVQTGIGRTGKLFAYEHYSINPDLVTMAKGLGGGLPIGGVLFNKSCDHVLKEGDHGTTYGGNPVICAGSIEVLRHINEDLLDDVWGKGVFIKEEAGKMEGIKSVTGMGLMIGLELESKSTQKVIEECINRGLILLSAKEKIRLLPPLNISYEEIKKGLEILKQVLKGK